MKEAVTSGESRCWERLRTGKEIKEQMEGCKLEQLGHLENNKNDGFCRQPNNRLAVFFYNNIRSRFCILKGNCRSLYKIPRCIC